MKDQAADILQRLSALAAEIRGIRDEHAGEVRTLRADNAALRVGLEEIRRELSSALRARASLERGRARRAAEQSEKAIRLRAAIVRAASADTKGPRGLAGRVARKLRRDDGFEVSEGHVRRILSHVQEK